MNKNIFFKNVGIYRDCDEYRCMGECPICNKTNSHGLGTTVQDVLKNNRTTRLCDSCMCDYFIVLDTAPTYSKIKDEAVKAEFL